MNFFDFCKAMDEAESAMRLADNNANRLARILKGRLRNISPNVAAQLKKELRDFNSNTKRWKEQT